MMSLASFLYNLHYDIEKESPTEWEVDWEDAPLTYKLYRDLPTVPLCHNIPLRLEGQEIMTKPELLKIGHYLWNVYGLTQICQSTLASGSDEEVGLMQSNRRFIPSGGALYPNELYVYLKCEDVAAGVYHYDVARHHLVLLREGNFDSFLSSALGNRCDVSNCFGAIFVSTMFWKNFFKYHNFSYRLQGLDAGVLVGQILEVAKRFGFSTGVYFQFLDRALNHLLGLNEEEESIYGVVPLSIEASNLFSNTNAVEPINTATELCKELPRIEHRYFIKSKKILAFPKLIQVNEASMIESTEIFRHIEEKKNIQKDSKQFNLPKVDRLSYDLLLINRKRFSPDMDFISKKVSKVDLATILQEATKSFSYLNDLDQINSHSRSRPSLYMCLNNVEDIPNGAYYYDDLNHSLTQIQLGDFRPQLQTGLSGTNVNLFQVPISLHVVGDQKHFNSLLGYRGYRIQHMEAGMMVQRLLLSSTALGMGGHPLLGFDAKLCDEIYKLSEEQKTSLIQIPIGYYRNRPSIQGGLHS
ncbi:SagB-type dehydrogenase family enzyme [Bacillus sp. OAE603]